MPNTTNFNWTTPADTDLVKDGALAIRTLANGIDTSLVDLKGGTTGQVLAKATNTDLDFQWVAQDDSNAIQNAIIDAKGDLIVGTAADTPARLAVGTNGQYLSANSSTASGLEWVSASSSGCTLVATLSPSGVSSSSADNVFTSTYDSYLIVGYITWTDNTNLEMRLRASGSDITTSTYFQDQTSGQGTAGSTFYLADNRGTNVITGFTMGLTNLGNSDYKIGNLQRTINATTGTYQISGFRNSTLSVTDGIKFFPSTGTMTGTIRIYGLAK